MQKKMLLVLLSVVMIVSILLGISACAPDDNIVKYTYTNSQGETSYFEINFDKEEYTYSGNACYGEGWGYMLIPNTRFEVSGYIRLDYKMNGYTVYKFLHHPWNNKYPMGITSDGNILRVQWTPFNSYDFIKEGYLQDENSGNNSNNNDENSNNNSEQQETTQTSYSIEYFVNDNNFGSVTGELNQTVQKNSNGSSVTAVAKEGYRFVGWSDGVTTATRQEKNVTKNISVTAYFEIIPTYTIAYHTGGNGSIDGETNQLVKEGENSSSVTAVPDEGYRFVGWSDGVKNATRQDCNVVSDVNVSATFELIEYTYTYKVQVSGGTPMGTLNGDRETVVEMKSSILNDYQGEPVTAYPSQEYYRFIGWSDGETEITRQDKIESDNEIIAQFELFYKFTFVAGEGGTIQGETYQEVGDGNYTTAVTAIANEGYEFWGWQYQQYHSDYYCWSESISLSTQNMLFSNTYTAIFKKVEYSAVYYSSYGGVIKYEYTPFDQNANNYNSNGVSSVTFTISIDNQFNAPQVTATPGENYRFVKWSDGNTSPTRQDLNLNGNLEIKAEFVRVYKFTFVAGEGGTIQGETYQEVDDGNYTTAVTAVANEGYEFLGWQYQQYHSDYYLWSETIIVSSNDWTFGDCYTAIFKKV